jgi:O-antigen/teichoic acid export membrane protein
MPAAKGAQATLREPGATTVEATTGRSVLVGGVWQMASFAIPQVYTIVLSIVAARFLGPNGMGVQSFIAFVALSTTIVLASSMYSALMRFVGETIGQGRNELLKPLFAWAWRVEGAAALVGAGAISAAAAFGAKPTAAWLLAAVVAAAGIMHSVPTALLIGLQRFRRASVVGLVTGFFSTLATVAVLWAGGGITGMFAVEAVFGVVNLAWTGTLARRSIGEAAPGAAVESVALRRSVGRYAGIAAVGVVLELIVGTRSEFYLLKHFSSSAQIAFYSIAFSTVTGLRLVPRALGGSTAPAFATLYGAGALDRMRSGYGRSLRLLMVVTLPLTAVGLALAPALIREVYGHSYDGAGRPLQILLIGFPVIALSSVTNGVLTGFGLVRLTVGMNAVAAAVDIALAVALIPSFDAEGASIANVGGEGVYVLLALAFAVRRLGRVDWRPDMMARSLAAAAGAGLAAWAVQARLPDPGGLGAGLAAAAAAYLAIGAVLRLLPAPDAKWLEEAFGEKAWGLTGRVVRLLAERGEAGRAAD